MAVALVTGVLAGGTLAVTAPAQAAPVEAVAVPVSPGAPLPGSSTGVASPYVYPYGYLDFVWLHRLPMAIHQPGQGGYCLQIYSLGPDGRVNSTCTATFIRFLAG
jgi:hypothetical protein